jgi:hypothetical protein
VLFRSPTDPLVLDWWQVATDEVPQREDGSSPYPCVHVRHAGARLGIRQAHDGVHDSTHSIVLDFMHVGEDREAMAAVMTYADEAFLRWMDTYPLGSRSVGGMTQKIAPPDGQNIRLQSDPVMARSVPQPERPDVVQYTWGFSLSFDVTVRDTTWSDTP